MIAAQLTKAQRHVLAAHHESDRNEARAVLTMPDEASWTKVCRELIEIGLLAWRKGPVEWLSPDQDGTGPSGQVTSYERVLTGAGLAALQGGSP